jgi:hypothetical protein
VNLCAPKLDNDETDLRPRLFLHARLENAIGEDAHCLLDALVPVTQVDARVNHGLTHLDRQRGFRGPMPTEFSALGSPDHGPLMPFRDP